MGDEGVSVQAFFERKSEYCMKGPMGWNNRTTENRQKEKENIGKEARETEQNRARNDENFAEVIGREEDTIWGNILSPHLPKKISFRDGDDHGTEKNRKITGVKKTISEKRKNSCTGGPRNKGAGKKRTSMQGCRDRERWWDHLHPKNF